ncbi:MAG: 6,7-dimethyl-8-ribityllumazine synthase [Methanobacteriota archaeon]|nr:MAG: 6,7-dimethyl-8-ribityllumazine synthase [Euryarchaeota archaeon]
MNGGRNVARNIAIVCGEFHRDEVEQMLEFAQAEATAQNLEVTQVVWVPGSMEAPLALQRLLENWEIDAAIVLGIIEKGETGHGATMGYAVTDAVIRLQLETGKPIGLGIIGPGAEPEHIPPRLEPHARNAVAAVASMLE